MRALSILVLVSSATLAHGQNMPDSIQKLLKNSDDPLAAIDAMDNRQRPPVIRDLARAVVDNPGNLELAQLMCAIQPWTTKTESDAGSDDAIQTALWERMRSLNAQSEEFRWLDCASVNRTGGYMEVAVNPLYNLRQSACTAIPVTDDWDGYYAGLIGSITGYNETISQGLSSDAANAPHSYYPTRNILRTALLGAGRGVTAAKSGQPDLARSYFADTAKELTAHLETIDYANTRNSWVFHSDLTLYATFYGWLGTGGALDMSALINWPPALMDAEIADAIPPATRAQIEKDGATDYVDPVYLERLLPRAAPKDQECSQWRRRSYDTRALAKVMQDCATPYANMEVSYAMLTELDQCIGAFEAADWRVQFSSVPKGGGSSELSRIKSSLSAILGSSQFAALPKTEQASIRANLETLHLEAAGSYARIVTDHGLTTSDRTALERIFDAIGLAPRPMMARQTIY